MARNQEIGPLTFVLSHWGIDDLATDKDKLAEAYKLKKCVKTEEKFNYIK